MQYSEDLFSISRPAVNLFPLQADGSILRLFTVDRENARVVDKGIWAMCKYI